MNTDYTLKPEKMAGKFICLDGIEGTGKSSQTRLLQEYLEQCGCSVITVRDPGGTPLGEKIREILLDPANTAMCMKMEMLLYMASRAQLVHEVIRPALAAGKVVLSDRFYSSTLAYQTCDAVAWTDIVAVGRVVLSGPEGWEGPDYTIIVDMPAERAMDRLRREKDRIERRPMEYHRQVRENFLRVVDEMPGCVVSADAEPGEVHAAIVMALCKRFGTIT